MHIPLIFLDKKFHFDRTVTFIVNFHTFVIVRNHEIFHFRMAEFILLTGILAQTRMRLKCAKRGIMKQSYDCQLDKQFLRGIANPNSHHKRNIGKEIVLLGCSLPPVCYTGDRR